MTKFCAPHYCIEDDDDCPFNTMEENPLKKLMTFDAEDSEDSEDSEEFEFDGEDEEL